jgi:hypothetical protein
MGGWFIQGLDFLFNFFILLSVVLRFAVSDYPFGIFNFSRDFNSLYLYVIRSQMCVYMLLWLDTEVYYTWLIDVIKLKKYPYVGTVKNPIEKL